MFLQQGLPLLKVLMTLAAEGPLSLQERMQLAKLGGWMRVPTVPVLPKASGAELATGKVCPEFKLNGFSHILQALRSFVDQILVDLRRSSQSFGIPRVGQGCLEREDLSRVDVNMWDPERENGYTLTVKRQDLDAEWFWANARADDRIRWIVANIIGTHCRYYNYITICYSRQEN